MPAVHTYTHARTHILTHARTHARTHTHTRTHALPHAHLGARHARREVPAVVAVAAVERRRRALRAVGPLRERERVSEREREREA